MAFVTIMFGFLLQWPTLLTLVMFPILVFMYAYLARTEGADMFAVRGRVRAVCGTPPRFMPAFFRRSGEPA